MGGAAARAHAKGSAPVVRRAEAKAPFVPPLRTGNAAPGPMNSAGPMVPLGVQRTEIPTAAQRSIFRKGRSGASRAAPSVIDGEEQKRQIQTKLAVGPAGDPFEREADAAADRVDAGQPVQRISRLPAQPGSANGSGPPDHKGLDTPRAEQAMAGAGPGAPLAPSMRDKMEHHFGADFSGVRVHREPTADEANRALDARAFTHGSHIWLGPSESSTDAKLMAHEATHVMQQGATTGGTAPSIQRLADELTPAEPGDAALKDKAEDVPVAPDRAAAGERSPSDAPARKNPDPAESARNKAEPEGRVKPAMDEANRGTQEPNPREDDTITSDRGSAMRAKAPANRSVTFAAKDSPRTEHRHQGLKDQHLRASEAESSSRGEDGHPRALQRISLPQPLNATRPALSAKHGKPASSRASSMGGQHPEARPPAPPEVLKVPSGQDVGPGEGVEKPNTDAPFTRLAALQTRCTNISGGRWAFAPSAAELHPDPQVAKPARAQQVAANTMIARSLVGNAGMIRKVISFGSQVPRRISQSSLLARASIDRSVAAALGIVITEFTNAKARAGSAAASARARINGAYEAALPVVQTANAGARAQIQASHLAAEALLAASEASQYVRIETIYSGADGKFRATGNKVGDEAAARGEQRKQAWLQQKDGESDLLDGPLHDNRLEARGDAAVQVAAEYKKGLIEEANKQADEAQKGKAKDYATVAESVRQSRETLSTLLLQSIAALDRSESQALESAGETKTRMLGAVEFTLATTSTASLRSRHAIWAVWSSLGSVKKRPSIAILRSRKTPLSAELATRLRF